GCSSRGFGQVLPHIVFIKERLPLKIGSFDEVAVYDTKKSCPGTREKFRRNAAQRADTDYGHARRRYLCLSSGPYGRKPDLTRIPITAFQTTPSPSSLTGRSRSPTAACRSS